MAAWEAAMRRAQLGSRWRRPEASQGHTQEGSRRSLMCMLVFMKKVGTDVMLVCMCARMYVMCGVRHRVIRAERYALVCVALHGVRGFKII